MPFPDNEIWAGLAVVLTMVAYVPYIRSILKGRIRPHAFSWLVWFVLTFIAFLAQVATGAGIGAWPTLLGALICLAVCIAGFCVGKKDIRRSDYIALAASALTLVLWYFTHDPLWSVILVVIIDAAGFYPTYRKAWLKPSEESALTFFLLGLSNAAQTLAVEHPNLTNLLFPAYLALMDTALAVFLLWRRNSLEKEIPA